MGSPRRIAFDRIAGEALTRAESIVSRWLADGSRDGAEWVCRNPRRDDRRPGSFKVNLTTGKWGDFAVDRTGGDLISLCAYLFDLPQGEAAKRIADMLGLSPYVD